MPEPIALDAGMVMAEDATPKDDDVGTSVDASTFEEDAAVSVPDAGMATPDSGPPQLGPTCFAEIFDPNANGPNYDQFLPSYAEHCLGTDHQSITGVERVVFLGDSVTVGTPPTPHEEYYRALLADRLAAHFNLAAPSGAWKRSSIINGTSLIRESGDFASCAKWGARTDDLLEDNTQLLDCFPADERNKTTLVVLTIGGNDIASITKGGAPSGGKTFAEVEMETIEFITKLEEAAQWFRDVDPDTGAPRFPNGVHLILSNMFEFTDATGDVNSCPAAAAAGFDEPWDNPADLEYLVIWANEQFMRIAVETSSDMIFMLEHFCGHGYLHDDPTNRCYRGPNSERWFDISCIHPNPTGHAVIAEMFMNVVLE